MATTLNSEALENSVKQKAMHVLREVWILDNGESKSSSIRSSPHCVDDTSGGLLPVGGDCTITENWVGYKTLPGNPSMMYMFIEHLYSSPLSSTWLDWLHSHLVTTQASGHFPSIRKKPRESFWGHLHIVILFDKACFGKSGY